MADADRRAILEAYSAGRLGTRQTIDLLDFDGYADLLIALAQVDLPLPKPSDTPARRADYDRASAILQPLLRRHGD